jgi:hypothetical protein
MVDIEVINKRNNTAHTSIHPKEVFEIHKLVISK